MQLDEAVLLTRDLINTRAKHQDYERVVDLADKYMKFTTGENIGSLLIHFVPREDPALFVQRMALTKSITPAIAAAITNPFTQAMRIQNIREGLKVKNERLLPIIQGMSKEFYGNKRKKVTGLKSWMNKRFKTLSFTDPNSWVVVEWDTPPNDQTPIKPRPFEVPAAWAYNYLDVNGELKWLWVNQPITYRTVKGASVPITSVPTPINAPSPMGGNSFLASTAKVVPRVTPTSPDRFGGIKAAGERWTLYDEDMTVVYEQVDPVYLEKSGYVMKEGESIIFYETQNVYYLMKVAYPKVGYPTAYRIGYITDPFTQDRTFVNPWHNAMPFFQKSLKTVSEQDITMTLHTFPQKYQYVSKCMGESKQKSCRDGRIPNTNDVCTVCKGTGYKIHTTGQDVIYLPMPESPEDMLDLEKLSAYKAPPIETVRFQNEYVLQLEQQALRAVFSSSVVIKTSGPTGSTDPVTATQAEIDIQGLYNAIEPYTEKDSELRKEFITLFGILAGERLEDIEVTYEYPADFKMKTLQMLLMDLKSSKDAGAPQYLVRIINDDIANLAYVGSPKELLMYRVKSAFMPFAEKSPEEIAEAISSQYVPKEPKVLYMNFGEIFVELLEEDPGFYERSTDVQNKAVKAKVAQYIQMLEAQQPAMDLTKFRAAPGVVPKDDEIDEEGNSTENTGNNPGDNQNDNNGKTE
jgi:hypothetical protein